MNRLLFALLSAVLLAGCSGCKTASASNADVGDASDANASSPGCELVTDDFAPTGTTQVRAEKVIDGLEVPWSIAFLPDAPGAMLITERPGRIRLYESGALVPEPVATIPIDRGGEGGLQGLVLDPQFAKNRRFFIYYTGEENGEKRNRVERWVLSADRRSARFDRRLVDGLLAAQFHHGGRLRIGPDGMLYVSVGDARHPELAQDPKARNGKILRLTPDGEIPKDNPIPGNPLWVLGVRNVEGFDWRDANTMVITDHGPSGELGRTGHDEVNVAHKGDNLGWPTIYGCEQKPGMVTPSLSWKEAVPPGGAAIYTGDAIPEWKGSLIVGTLGSRHVHRVVFGPDGRTVARHEKYFEGDPPEGLGRVREVVMGPDGELYATTSNCDGRGTCPETKDWVVRIVPARAR